MAPCIWLPYVQVATKMSALQEAMKDPAVQQQMAEMQSAMQNKGLQDRMAALKVKYDHAKPYYPASP